MRNPMEKLMDDIEWKELPPIKDNDDNLPYATHMGILRIGDAELECAQLNTGERVITEEGMRKFLGYLIGKEE